MHVISRKALTEFAEKVPDAKSALDAWYHDTKKASWYSWTDLKEHDKTVSSVGKDRYVFNIKGNKYRIIALIKFMPQVVYIRFVGTHKEYDKIDAKEV